MAELMEITKVAIGPRTYTARVRVAEGAPLTTDEDLVGTTLVYRLLPEITDHACIGEGVDAFRDVMGDTSLAHLMEHVAIELIARTNLGGDVSCGRTWAVEDEPRCYEIQLACPDDVLVSAALSSAAWVMQWAYAGGEDPEPNIDATVMGIQALVANAEEMAAEDLAEQGEGEPADEAAEEPAGDAVEPVADGAPVKTDDLD